jgi:hypothetical protein
MGERMRTPSRDQVIRHAVSLGVTRAAFGAPAVWAPDVVARGLALAGAREDESRRFFAGFFGVREMLLAAFILASRSDLRKLRPTLAFAALSDLGDTAVVLREIARGRRPEPGAAFLLLSALGGSAASIAVWWESRNVERHRSTQDTEAVP